MCGPLSSVLRGMRNGVSRSVLSVMRSKTGTGLWAHIAMSLLIMSKS